MTENFEIGDLVWAKMKNYPAWPARVVEPKPEIKPPKNKKAYFVLFFGSENFAWIPEENLSHHDEEMLGSMSNKKKSKALKDAIDALADYAKKESIPPRKRKRDDVEKEDANMELAKSEPVKKKVSSESIRTPMSNKSSKGEILEEETVPSSSDSSSLPPTLRPVKKAKIVKYLKKFEKRKVKLLKSKGLSKSSKSLLKPTTSQKLSESNSLLSDESLNLYVEDRFQTASPIKVGFIGLGPMGKAILQNMVISGHDVTIWNRSMYKCSMLNFPVKRVNTAAELITECEVVICCVSDPKASRDVIFNERGILKGLDMCLNRGGQPKAFVEFTTLDALSSQRFHEVITKRNGLYLEAPLIGTVEDAKHGKLLITASGDADVFRRCESIFHAISKKAFFLKKEVGYASKMSLAINASRFAAAAAISEVMALAQKLKLPMKKFKQLLELGPLSNKNPLAEMQKAQKEGMVSPLWSTSQMLRDSNDALQMSNLCYQPLYVTAAATQVYKRALDMGIPDNDCSALYTVYKM